MAETKRARKKLKPRLQAHSRSQKKPDINVELLSCPVNSHRISCANSISRVNGRRRRSFAPSMALCGSLRLAICL